MAALRHEETDRIAWSPLICGYFSLGLAEPMRGDDIAVQRAIGADVMERIAAPVVFPTIPLLIPSAFTGKESVADDYVSEIGRITVRQQRKGDQLLRTFETPVGILREIYETRQSSPWMAFPVEHKLKTSEDIETYHYVVESQSNVRNYDVFNWIDQEIGEDGIATTSSPLSPFQLLLEVECGLEMFYYFMADYPQRMHALMVDMHTKNLEACKIIAESPAEVIIIYENTSTSTSSPSMYQKYALEHLNEYADLYHKHKKILLIHACGKLKDLSEAFGRAQFDGVCDIAPPPTGDLTLYEAKKVWGDRKVTMGGIDATEFIRMSPDTIKAHVHTILEQVSRFRGVILGSGDAVPYGTPIENLIAVTEAVNEFIDH